MPFTPFHFGPGVLFKSVEPRRMSLTAFMTAQVLIDVEPLVYLIRNERPVHRFFHSIPGSLVVAATVAVILLMARRPLLRLVAVSVPALSQDLSAAAVAAGAAVGSVSHVLLDLLVHRDVRLFYPSGIGQAMGGRVGLGRVELACVVAGALGLAALWWRSKRG